MRAAATTEATETGAGEEEMAATGVGVMMRTAGNEVRVDTTRTRTRTGDPEEEGAAGAIEYVRVRRGIAAMRAAAQGSQ